MITVVTGKHAQMCPQEIKPPSKQLHGPDNKLLKVLGEIQGRRTYKDKDKEPHTQSLWQVAAMDYLLKWVNEDRGKPHLHGHLPVGHECVWLSTCWSLPLLVSTSRLAMVLSVSESEDAEKQHSNANPN